MSMFSLLTGGSNLKKLHASSNNELKRKRDTVDVSAVVNDEECINFRRRMRMNVTGEQPGQLCYPLTSFDEKLPAFLLKNLNQHEYSIPTPIQMQAISLLLAKHDLLACAPTGSGKTLAFAIPILAALKEHKTGGYRAVVVSPTRELAQQIYQQFKRLSAGNSLKVNLLTKSNATIQLNKETGLANAYDILITTPLRLVNAIKEEKIELSHVKTLVLDEADRLFETGFVEQTDEILAACTCKKLKKALFSATLPSGVEQLAKTVMVDPVRLIVGQKDTATDLIQQKLIYVGNESGKLLEVRQLAKSGGLKPPVLIFVQSIERAKELYSELADDGLQVDAIHSDKPQAQRDEIITDFRLGKIWVLVATELLSRGIDFQGVELVINYDFPQSVQSYIHRIGRTGRAGRSGTAITFFSKEDGDYLKSIASVIRSSGGEVPEWMLAMKAPSKNKKRALKRKPIDRKHISTVAHRDAKNEAHRKDIIRNSVIKKRKLEKSKLLPTGDHSGDSDE